MATFGIPELSREARELLLEAAQDPRGQVRRVAHGGEVFLRTNGKQFIEEEDARSRAAWEGAFGELIDEQLVEDVDRKGHIFQVTRRGYHVADQLAPG